MVQTLPPHRAHQTLHVGTLPKASGEPSELPQSPSLELADGMALHKSSRDRGVGSGALPQGNASTSCYAVHSEVGWAVTLKWSRRRRSCAKTIKTYRTRKVTVGTTKKSVETNCCTWFSRKVRQVWEGGLHWRPMYFATVAWDTSIPILSSSPWIRGAPQRGFALLI